jgi:hypothetical protein
LGEKGIESATTSFLKQGKKCKLAQGILQALLGLGGKPIFRVIQEY